MTNGYSPTALGRKTTDELIRLLGNARWSGSPSAPSSKRNAARRRNIELLLEARGLDADTIAAIR